MRKNRLIETVTNLLLNQIRTMWDSDDFITSILLLDISEAFDRIVKKRLIHILQWKDISFSIANWIDSFMIDRSITLLFEKKKFKVFKIQVSISQDSFLSFILFLFYNLELIECCNSIKKRIICMNFVDNVNLLAFNFITKRNCKVLKNAHEICLDWVSKHEVFFISQKYELIHLT
jgi:hypothetical protein